jgi:hypothetical protein
MPEKKYGFKDNRTPAEIALAPGKPAGREAPSSSGVKPTGGKKGGLLGTIAKAATMSSATYVQFKAALNAKNSLKTLASSLTGAVAGFDAHAADLLSGRTVIKDVSVFGMNSTINVSTGGFFSAEDLVQFSSIRTGVSLAGSAAFKSQLAQRKKRLSNISARVSTQLGNFSLFGAHVKENYNRTPYPLPEEVDAPSVPRLAQGGDAALTDPVVKDKRRFVIKGAAVALAKPTFWTRLTTSVTDPLKAYKKMPGFNLNLNMSFHDDKNNQSGWSEPATPASPQFPYNKVTQTESGHVIELDDTPGAERVHLFHRSGSFIEMHPDGQVVYKSMNHGFLISMADQNVKVKGNCNISVDGNASIHARGEVSIQSDSDVNINTKKDFNVFAKNVNLRAKKTALLDGVEVDLRYAKLPGTPVFTSNGPAVRLIPSAIKRDFPEIAQQIDGAQAAYKGKLNKLKAAALLKMGTQLATSALAGGAFGAATVGTTYAMAQTILSGTKDTLSMLSLMQDGPFPSTGSQIAFTFPELTAEQTPKDNPLGNPLIYNVKTRAAADYRALMFDTPEELSDAEQYQAHLDTCKALGDLPETAGPELPGTRNTIETGIVAAESIPEVNYLNRDAYRGNYTFTPKTTLGGTSFTVEMLADSLARPDVANYTPQV